MCPVDSFVEQEASIQKKPAFDYDFLLHSFSFIFIPRWASSKIIKSIHGATVSRIQGGVRTAVLLIGTPNLNAF